MAGKWYIINVLSGYEHKVAKSISDCAEQKDMQNLIEQVIVPMENFTEIKKGKKVISERKVFPGYVMVKMELNDRTWNLVKNMPKVSGLLGGSGKPMPVPESQVSRLLQRAQEVPVIDDGICFSMGEVVKIIDGPFESFSGTVDKIDSEKKRLKVSVSIFGRLTPVDLELNQVEKQQ